MRNWAILFLLSSLLAAIGFAQEGHPAPPKAGEAEQHAAGGEHGAAAKHGEAAAHDQGDPMIMWKWINFGILAIGLGYLVSKNLPPFFASRTEEIQKGIAEAAKMKADADARAANMEQRMAKLGAEIETLRTQGKAEMAAEGERIRKESEQLVAKLQYGAESEIESAAKAARQELKAYAARLAVDLAEQRIRARASGGSEAKLVDKFIHNLETKGANN
jgi:F-type H+-transporting ATPase subunit b